ncbi:MAG: hypothetical protein N3D20_02345 [Candidatus Pacearchaeota archaeon]|nr:hypothetical protein [Candidatus Pacearchaeota archaeon]
MALNDILEGYRTSAEETNLLDKIQNTLEKIPDQLFKKFTEIEEKRKNSGLLFLLGEIIYSTLNGHRLIHGHYPKTKEIFLEEYEKRQKMQNNLITKIEGDCIYT